MWACEQGWREEEVGGRKGERGGKKERKLRYYFKESPPIKRRKNFKNGIPGEA